jgi:hypothetical protein
MHPSVLIFDKIRTNKNLVLRNMDWKAQNNIWSFKASKLSSLPKQLPSEALQGSRCVVVKKAEDQAVGEAAAAGSGEPVG